MAEQNSLLPYGNRFDTDSIAISSSGFDVLNYQDQPFCESFGPSMLQGDLCSLRSCHDGTNSARISASYALANANPERDSVGDCLYGVPNSMNQAHLYGHYMEGMPLSVASLSTISGARVNPTQNLQHFAASDALPHTLGLSRSANSIDNSDQPILLSQRLCHGFKWDESNPYQTNHPSKAIDRTGLQSFGSTVTMDPHGWVTSQDTMLGSDNAGLSMLSNELSLSLATAKSTVVCNTSIQDQGSEMCCSSSQYHRCLGSGQTSCSRNSPWRFGSSRPIQLFQLFSGSNYVNAIQEILAAVALYSLENFDQGNYPASGAEDQGNSSFTSPDSDDFPYEDHGVTLQALPSIQGTDLHKKRKRLLALLQVVDKQYNQCLDEIHTVISAFHAVTELNPHVHARFALQTISLLYKSLRERISNHIIAEGTNFVNGESRMEEKSFETSFIQKQWAIQQLRRKENQLMRPQRGLPERSVSVLRAWMFQNFLHPYPKDAEKHLLAVKSGLSRGQVSNWFINARVRLWKPMIEEMYAEMNRRKRHQNEEETTANQRSHITLENQRNPMF